MGWAQDGVSCAAPSCLACGSCPAAVQALEHSLSAPLTEPALSPHQQQQQQQQQRLGADEQQPKKKKQRQGVSGGAEPGSLQGNTRRQQQHSRCKVLLVLCQLAGSLMCLL
jgi:hypothetical protein